MSKFKQDSVDTVEQNEGQLYLVAYMGRNWGFDKSLELGARYEAIRLVARG